MNERRVKEEEEDKTKEEIREVFDLPEIIRYQQFLLILLFQLLDDLFEDQLELDDIKQKNLLNLDEQKATSLIIVWLIDLKT